MSKHRFNIFIMLIIVLLIIAAIFQWRIGSASPKEPAESASPKVTAAPSPSASPSQMPDEFSGSLQTTTGTNLNMSVKWQVTEKDDDTVTVTATAYIYSYAINVGSLAGSMSINGKEEKFVSQPINYNDNEKLNEVTLHTMTVDLPVKKGETVSIPVKALWDFKKEYDGTSFNGIKIDDYIQISHYS